MLKKVWKVRGKVWVFLPVANQCGESLQTLYSSISRSMVPNLLQWHLLSSQTSIPVYFDDSDSLPLVLTHEDITGSVYNVRLGIDGKVWLLDWGFACMYPQWFEYATIMAYASGRKVTVYDPPHGWFDCRLVQVPCLLQVSTLKRASLTGKVFTHTIHVSKLSLTFS
jgi:hypothetical protein